MKNLAFLIILCLFTINCGRDSTSSEFDSVNFKTRPFPINQLQIGKRYVFILIQKEDGGSKGKADITISGNLIEIDKENGWLKVQNNSGNFDFIYFKDIERFTEYTDKTLFTTNSNTVNRAKETEQATNQNINKTNEVLKNSPSKTPYVLSEKALEAAAKEYKKREDNLKNINSNSNK